MELFSVISLPALVALLVAAVNILTEITKKILPVKKPQAVAVAWAVLLSAAVCIVAAVMQGWTLWWMILLAAVAGVLVGVVVAYAAMFGYDEAYAQVIAIFQSLIDYLNGGGKTGGNDKGGASDERT